MKWLLTVFETKCMKAPWFELFFVLMCLIELKRINVFSQFVADFVTMRTDVENLHQKCE